ncbi:hypothetical protein MKW94_015596 [Papaver nudicaule]|uniref:Uncharacterized protein n=1 Tax=Papaver nudicaule TaxID=74823 RepID=A0AA41SLA5_PAPNU|nr:hypothetical protein [Papaver nudicaule]
MGDSSPSEDSDSEYVNSLHDLGQLHEDYNKQCAFTENSTYDDYMLGELIPVLSDVLHLQDTSDEISDSDTSSDDVGEVCALNRSATFPCSKKEMPDDVSHEPSADPTYNRSKSLPVPLKSALKGGREKYGMPVKKLTVTWAHDVYDPPVTLVSHSVKGGHSHHRSSRSSSSRRSSSSSSNNSKHKHKGGKSSSRSSSSDTHKKHHHHRKHSGSHHESRTRPVECRDRLSPLLNAMSRRSTAELSDFSVGARSLQDNNAMSRRSAAGISDFSVSARSLQDNNAMSRRSAAGISDFSVSARSLQDNIKCGTSYFMKSLTELHLPVAEAT